MDERETGTLLGVLKAAWPARVFEQDTVTAYHMAWSDLPFDVAKVAVTRWIRTATFFPSPGEIRSLALKAALGLPPAEIAWAEVQRQIGAVGHTGVPAWSTAALEATVAAIGWRSLCLCEEGDLGTLRAQFRNTYDRYQDRELATDDATAAIAAARDRAAGQLQAAERRRALPEPEPGRVGPALPEGERNPRFFAEWREREFATRHPKAVRSTPPDMLRVLCMLPEWRELSEERRAFLLARHSERADGTTGPESAFVGDEGWD